MNAIRAAMTVFLSMVLMLCILGWRWSAGLPSPKIEGARVALTLSALFAIGALCAIWSAKPRSSS